MAKYYEIIMKNGLSIIVFTDREGICEFSINGNDFYIFSGEERVNLSVSAEKAVIPGIDQTEVLIDHQFTVLSIRSLHLKSLKGSRKVEVEKGKSMRRESFERRNRSFTWEQNYFCAHHGGIKTPKGWLFGEK